MDNNQFTIKLGVDNSGAKDAVKQSIFDFKKLAEAGKEAAKIMDYEGNRAAKDIADAAKKSAAEQQAAADAARTKWVDGFKDAGGAANGFLKTLLGFGSAVAVFNKLKESVGAIKQIMDSVRDKQDQNVAGLGDTRKLVRDIAAMQGTTPTDAYVRQFNAMLSRTGLERKQGAAFLQEMVGSGEAVKGNIAQEGGYQEYIEKLGKYAALQGGGTEDAGAYARMGGILLGLGKYKTADEALAANQTLTNQISAGVGNNPELVRQGTKVAGTFMNEGGTGRIRNATELGALIGTASRINPEEAAETLKIGSRVLFGLDEKHGGMLRAAGIGEKDQLVDAYLKLFKHLRGVEASGRDVGSYLSEQGVQGREADRIRAMYNYAPFLEQQLKVAPVAAGDANKILAERFAADPGVQFQALQNQTDAAKMDNAMANQNRQFVVEAAKRRLEAKGLGEDSPLGAQRAWEIGIQNDGFGLGHPGESNTAFGFRAMLDQEVAKMAEERGFRLPGRPETITSPTGRLTGDGYSFAYKAWLDSNAPDAYETLGSTMRLSDPGMTGAGPRGMAGVAQKLDRTNQLLEQQNRMVADDRPRVMAPADVPRNVPR